MTKYIKYSGIFLTWLFLQACHQKIARSCLYSNRDDWMVFRSESNKDSQKIVLIQSDRTYSDVHQYRDYLEEKFSVHISKSELWKFTKHQMYKYIDIDSTFYKIIGNQPFPIKYKLTHLGGRKKLIVTSHGKIIASYKIVKIQDPYLDGNRVKLILLELVYESKGLDTISKIYRRRYNID